MFGYIIERTIPDHVIHQIQQSSEGDKYLASIQILLSIFLTLGATLVAIGSTFAAGMITTTGDDFNESFRISAIYYVVGILLLVFGVEIFRSVFGKVFARRAAGRDAQKLQVLVDEMLDGTDEKLRTAGYDAYSVKKLKEKGKNLHSDYSILKYAENNNMALITEDDENIEACNENNIRVIKYGQNNTFEELISGLQKLLPN